MKKIPEAVRTATDILFLCLIYLAVLFLVGFIGPAVVSDSSGNSDAGSQTADKDNGDGVFSNDSDGDSTYAAFSYPDRETVESKRKLALEGMSKEDIATVTSFVISSHELLAQYIDGEDFTNAISDPSHPIWNTLDETGEIVIGYAFDGEIWEKRDTLGLTEEEFTARYGEPVYHNNEHDADGMIQEVSNIKALIKNEDFRNDFDNVIKEIESLKETHDDVHVYNIAEIFHDMDYYLLRYGLDFVTTATITEREPYLTYYGVLTLYEDPA